MRQIANENVQCRQPGSLNVGIENNTASYSETQTELANILQCARDKTGADAGTIYLVENDALTFALAQNDTLFPQSERHKFYYLNARVPLDASSIAGYVAVSGGSLNIPDVYELDSSVPFSFKREMDKATGYRTISVLTMPLTHEKQILGVLQLINSTRDGKIQQFTEAMEREVQALCHLATRPLQQALRFTNQELRRRLLIYETLLDAMPNPVFAKDGDGHFSFFNKAYERFFGVRREDLLGKSALDHNGMPSEDRNRHHSEDIKAIGSGQELHYETAYTTEHGQRDALYWSKGIAFATGEKALVGELVDISHLKQLEKELAAKIEELNAERERLHRLHDDQQQQDDGAINLEAYNTFLARIETLSRAELRLFNLYVKGRTSREAADILHVSINTIRTHNQHIFAKFGVSSHKELMVYVGMMG